ncbi:hypothetical protein WA1_27360 [Scytonema hofmannii PCC 7110]|uniref:Uncharacterized protein n=1 Tax=Scytonema hofmannii PCC 7110 TaxID=128403 RepID=A0A139X6F1_9CYAN|nr:hypothetical protein [Scytonema hofmannii]KYC40254.1 hypothetical protein WA1_27360 [Scytonema hofmannii PCC 7110]
MNLWQKKGIDLLRWFMALVLVLNVTSCGNSEKAVSQEPFGSLQENVRLSGQISEVSPPVTIQELRQALEIYEPQVTIVAPKADETLQDNTVTVRFQVKDLPIFKDSKWDLGPHLHVILDNEPYIAVYNLDQPLILSDLSPGTHTLRVFASRPWHESFKNEGAYAQSTFHIFTKTDNNNPDPKQPLLTYSRPKGDYGAEPILLDFYLTNAPLHLVARENPNDEIADWRIRCTINGESFVLDRWQSVYLKGFKPGKNWVELEFLDEQGNPVKNVFNSTARLITYDPKGQDTLSRIVRGELSADQVRSIVDPNYTYKTPVAEPTRSQTPVPTVEKAPQVQPQEQQQPVLELEPTPVPTSIPSVEEKAPETPVEEPKQSTSEPELQEIPQAQPEKAKSRGFFNRFGRRPETTPTPETTVTPTPSEPPTLPEIIESPQPETTVEPQASETPKSESKTIPETLTQPEQTTTVEPTTSPEAVAPQSEKKGRFSQYFNRQTNKTPVPEVTVEPTPSVPPTLPEIIESPQSETVVP